ADDHARIGEQPRHLPDAPHVLRARLGCEAEVGVEAVAEVVAVEQVGGSARFEQQALARGGDGRLARPGEPGEPDRGAARQTLLTADVAGMPDDVRAARARRSHGVPARIMPAATVLLVASSTRMKLPVVRLRRYSS